MLVRVPLTERPETHGRRCRQQLGQLRTASCSPAALIVPAGPSHSILTSSQAASLTAVFPLWASASPENDVVRQAFAQAWDLLWLPRSCSYVWITISLRAGVHGGPEAARLVGCATLHLPPARGRPGV